MANEQDPNRADYSDDTYSDVKMIVGGKEFFVLKRQLARNIPYFQNLFFGPFSEANKDVVELKDICPQAFQIFLECCDGRFSVNDENVNAVAQLADMFLSPIVQDHCVNWLLKESKLILIDKFDISCSYNLHEVKEATIAKMTPAELMEAKEHPRCGEEALRLIIARLFNFVPAPVDALPAAAPVVQQDVVPNLQQHALLEMALQQNEQRRQQQLMQQMEQHLMQRMQQPLQEFHQRLLQQAEEFDQEQQRQLEQLRQNNQEREQRLNRQMEQDDAEREQNRVQFQQQIEEVIQQLRDRVEQALPPAIPQPPLHPRQQNRQNRIPRVRR